jgi:hypothetical protein
MTAAAGKRLFPENNQMKALKTVWNSALFSFDYKKRSVEKSKSGGVKTEKTVGLV